MSKHEAEIIFKWLYARCRRVSFTCAWGEGDKCRCNRDAEKLVALLEADRATRHVSIRQAMSILQRLYDSEIAFGIEAFPSDGFTAWVINSPEGASEKFKTWAECESWLESTARALYPESKFAQVAARPSISEDK